MHLLNRLSSQTLTKLPIEKKIYRLKVLWFIQNIDFKFFAILKFDHKEKVNFIII